MKQRVSLGAALGLSLALSAACDGGGSGGSQNGGASGGATNGTGASAGGSGSASAGTNDPNGGTNAGNGGTNDSGATNGGVNGGNNGTPPACNASSAPAIGKLALERVVTVGGGFNLVHAAQPPGSTDWYLVSQQGEIRVFKGSGTPAPFMTVPDVEFVFDERGLLSLAFAPDYATSRKLYVMASPGDGTTYGGRDVVFEYLRDASDPYKVAASAPKAIVDVPASATNHNGGTVMFGPDGMLYVGTGDGGGGCNDLLVARDKPQDVTSLFGKILRLDLSKPDPYAAAGNPFGNDPRVLHYGLRNPFRFGFDRVTGDLYIADVGQDDYEEINFAASGATSLNFGWADYEGTAANTCSSDRKLRTGSAHTGPIVAIKHDSTQGFADYESIIGGFVYRGSSIAALQGAYLFGDYKGQRMAALYHCGDQTSPLTPINKKCDLNSPSEACFVAKGGAPGLGDLAAIVEGNDGEIYLVGNGTTLYKVVPN